MRFEHILIAEDQQMANLSLRITLEALQLPQPRHCYYCEDALKVLQIGLRDGKPFDLLVTDLYFEPDGSHVEMLDGRMLIEKAREFQPGLKILVLSAETRQAIINELYEQLGIDGFVRKGRGDAEELKDALKQIANNRKYYSRNYRPMVKQENQHNFTPYDKTIIRLAAEGLSQQQISEWLEKNNLSPSSLSSIEKRFNLIKNAMDFKKLGQLIAFCTEMGIIK